MVLGLEKKVNNWMQLRKGRKIEIVKLVLVLFVRHLLFQNEACFNYIKKNDSYYEPRT
jgi:hypothetical protein